MTINLFHLIYLLIPLSPSQDTHSSGNAGGGPINFYDYFFLSERRGTPQVWNPDAARHVSTDFIIVNRQLSII